MSLQAVHRQFYNIEDLQAVDLRGREARHGKMSDAPQLKAGPSHDAQKV
jgi:hypothetical protein